MDLSHMTHIVYLRPEDPHSFTTKNKIKSCLDFAFLIGVRVLNIQEVLPEELPNSVSFYGP